jgi:hypothetical protein
MSNDSQRWFSNAIQGIPAVGADVNIFDVHAVPKYAVGSGWHRSDGNVYRYGYASGGVARGLFVAPTFATAGKSTISTSVITPSSAVAVAGESLRPGYAGSRYFEITAASVTANQFQGGYCLFEGGSGSGYTHRIRGNTATDNPASGNCRIELREPIQSSLAGSTNVIIVPNPFNDVSAADPSTNVAVCGVSCATTTTAKPYGWFCVRGTVGAMQDGSVTSGQAIQLSRSSGTSGAYQVLLGAYTYIYTAQTIAGLQPIGECIQPGASGLYGIVQVNFM